MDFSMEGQGRRNVTGLSIAVLAHLVLGYALVSGLAQKVVKVLKQPLEVSLLDEVKQPPPPPPPVPVKIAVQPPKSAPPPLYVPPPEAQPRAPVADSVTAVVDTPPPVADPTPAPVVAKPAVVEAPPAPVPATAAPVVAIGAACPNHASVRSKVDYPAQAQLRGLSGDVVIELTVGTNGEISGAHTLRSTSPIFEDAALTAVTHHLHCVAQGQEVRVRIPFNFRISQ